MNFEIYGWKTVAYINNENINALDWAQYDFTYYNYLELKEGYIFDGNGHEIKMDHSILWNDASGNYWDAHEYYGWSNLNYRTQWGQRGPFKLTNYWRSPFTQNAASRVHKNNTIKNLKLTGTAPLGNGLVLCFGNRVRQVGILIITTLMMGPAPLLNIWNGNIR